MLLKKRLIRQTIHAKILKENVHVGADAGEVKGVDVGVDEGVDVGVDEGKDEGVDVGVDEGAVDVVGVDEGKDEGAVDVVGVDEGAEDGIVDGIDVGHSNSRMNAKFGVILSNQVAPSSSELKVGALPSPSGRPVDPAQPTSPPDAPVASSKTHPIQYFPGVDSTIGAE